jgi:hypothetical protein
MDSQKHLCFKLGLTQNQDVTIQIAFRSSIMVAEELLFVMNGETIFKPSMIGQWQTDIKEGLLWNELTITKAILPRIVDGQRKKNNQTIEETAHI